VTELPDPGASPRQDFRGEAARERPIYEQESIGPWRGRVAATPVVRLDREPYFEVIAEWGPGPNGEDVPGLFGQPSAHAIDTAAVADAAGAERIARAAVDALRAPGPGRLPPVSLPALAKQFGVPLLRDG
jgi:hypothetical protein